MPETKPEADSCFFTALASIAIAAAGRGEAMAKVAQRRK